MRALSYVQVLSLLGLLAYLLLIALENPTPLRFPLPMGRGEWLVPGGVALAGALLLGGLYASLLFLPVLLHAKQRQRQANQSKRQVENMLASTLQARLSALPAEGTSSLPNQTTGETSLARVQPDTP